MKHCSVPDCERTDYYARGYCKLHYTRWWKHGDPEVSKFLPIEQKLEARIGFGEMDECWLWRGGTNGNGYGHISGRWNDTYRCWMTHRLAFEIATAPFQRQACAFAIGATPQCV